MTKYTVRPIGTIRNNQGKVWIQVDPQYIPALTGIEGFSHLQVIWWFSELDDESYRTVLTIDQPYRQAPETMGIFATRSPVRPNPLALSAVEVAALYIAKGIIQLTYCDADDGTPVLDIKPYTPSADRVESPRVPSWCASWPASFEQSGDFDWEAVFNF